jgi:hypothetical protein
MRGAERSGQGEGLTLAASQYVGSIKQQQQQQQQ